MGDFIEFVNLVAKSPPKLSIALIGVALQQYWFQSLAAIYGIGGIALFAYFLRRKPRIEWHELLAKPVPMPEPHKAPIDEPITVNCKCTMEPITSVDEDVFTAWHKALIQKSGIAFSKEEARKLYAANTRHQMEVSSVE